MGVDEADRRALALWAADCAERVLPLFEGRHPDDGRVPAALAAARAWTRGKLTVDAARAAAFAAHAAARHATDPAARAAARSAGHAAATAHATAHAAYAAAYAVVALLRGADTTDPAKTMATERDWQRDHLPPHLLPVVWPENGGA